MEKLSIVLKKMREKKNFTIEELAKKAGVGKGTVGDIETGKNKSTVKTLNKLAIALELNLEEKNELDSAFLGRKISGFKVPSHDRMQLGSLLQEATLFFNNNKISKEDKKKLIDLLNEIYFKNKTSN